ncbi:hypothetical protein SMALB_0115 [Streptomyces malaysiensis]|uniref:Uncharacterized protein n=1 Tax=Streptomyces malaysiensis TaxID=92644 RepID=A0A7X6ATK3_STRMQ|nr:hypothetical protein [Streptomyces malaysiensis]
MARLRRQRMPGRRRGWVSERRPPPVAPPSAACWGVLLVRPCPLGGPGVPAVGNGPKARGRHKRSRRSSAALATARWPDPRGSVPSGPTAVTAAVWVRHHVMAHLPHSVQGASAVWCEKAASRDASGGFQNRARTYVTASAASRKRSIPSSSHSIETGREGRWR